MAEYSVKISETSSELSVRERIALKDTSNMRKLDEVAENRFSIKPVGYAVLFIHNEKSDNVDYENYVVMAYTGEKFVTGSHSFWNSFRDIYDEMQDAPEDEEWEIEIYKKESKNFKGKSFITCSIV